MTHKDNARRFDLLATKFFWDETLTVTEAAELDRLQAQLDADYAVAMRDQIESLDGIISALNKRAEVTL